MVDQIISASNTIKTTLEYSELASYPELSEEQADRIEYILIEASNNPILNFWISEIDHCIGHHLELTTREINFQYTSQKSLLQEHFKTFLEALDASLETGKLQSEADARYFLKKISKDMVSPFNWTIPISTEKRANNSP